MEHDDINIFIEHDGISFKSSLYFWSPQNSLYAKHYIKSMQGVGQTHVPNVTSHSLKSEEERLLEEMAVTPRPMVIQYL
jgi:hypothetical protein